MIATPQKGWSQSSLSQIPAAHPVPLFGVPPCGCCSQELLSLPRPQRQHSGPTLDTRMGDSTSELPTPLPLHVLCVPAQPGENGAGEKWEFLYQNTVSAMKDIFACAFYSTEYKMPPPLLSWIGNNWGICWQQVSCITPPMQSFVH